MAANYVLLEKIVVGAAGASTVTFSGIPQTGYTDLVLKVSTRTNRSAATDGLEIRLNAATANHSGRRLTGDGSAAASSVSVYGNTDGNSATASTFGNAEIYIPNYTSSNYKSFSMDTVSENNATANGMTLNANLWSDTTAVSSIVILMSDGTSFNQYSTFYLYGVAALGTTPAIVPYATGGDTIMTDGTYWYHAFKSSGTFTPAKALSCDVLAVAGGGGGGTADLTGGGGAGGIFYATSQSVSVTGYTITVGAGGAINAVGSNSQFGSLTVASGGGRGGHPEDTAGGTGGSGGGAARATSVQGTPGSSNQSSTGGTGYGNAGGPSTPYASSGLDLAGSGGGAGAAGTRRTTSATPANNNGGIGLNTWSSWASATGTGDSGYFAGGGGVGGNSYAPSSPTGSFGGTGGGGRGGITDTNAGTAGTANTGGGGGGGASFGGAGAAGGSGIVIVRYAV